MVIAYARRDRASERASEREDGRRQRGTAHDGSGSSRAGGGGGDTSSQRFTAQSCEDGEAVGLKELALESKPLPIACDWHICFEKKK